MLRKRRGRFVVDTVQEDLTLKEREKRKKKKENKAKSKTSRNYQGLLIEATKSTKTNNSKETRRQTCYGNEKGLIKNRKQKQEIYIYYKSLQVNLPHVKKTAKQVNTEREN